MINYATSNSNKFREAQYIFGDTIIHCKLDLEEIQSLDTMMVARHKIKQIDSKYWPVIVEDIGLHIDTWNGFPGALIKWVGETITYPELHEMFGYFDAEATWITSVVYFDGENQLEFKGETRGCIVDPRGSSWGFESSFRPDGINKTVAELTLEEKLEFSPRLKALVQLKKTVIK